MGEKSDAKRPRRVASRFFHAVMTLVYFLLFILALVSMSAFANLHLEIINSDVYGGNTSAYGKCILNANPDPDNSYPQIILNNNTNACNYAIVGEAIIAIYALVAIVVMVIKIIAGTEL